MTDSDFASQKKRIQDLAEKWLAPLGLLWWRIYIEYSREPLPSRKDGDGWGCVGKAAVKWEYLEATLSFDLRLTSNHDDERLEYIFVHECCHILVHEMRSWNFSPMMPAEQVNAGMEHEERVVTCMAKAFIWTRKAGAGAFAFQPAN